MDLVNDTIVLSDFIEHPMPSYFFAQLKIDNPELHKQLKDARIEYANQRTFTQEELDYQDKFNIENLKEKPKRDKI